LDQNENCFSSILCILLGTEYTVSQKSSHATGSFKRMYLPLLRKEKGFKYNYLSLCVSSWGWTVEYEYNCVSVEHVYCLVCGIAAQTVDYIHRPFINTYKNGK
jgi:hypothetical protein